MHVCVKMSLSAAMSDVLDTLDDNVAKLTKMIANSENVPAARLDALMDNIDVMMHNLMHLRIARGLWLLVCLFGLVSCFGRRKCECAIR